MTEELLQFAWKYQLIQKDNLQTTEGESVKIISSGKWNANSGPDFFNASIKIGDTLWAGNVEVHLKASDWLKHHHQNDEAYNNVILHVVKEADQKINLPNGQRLPALAIVVNKTVEANYEYLLEQSRKPACYESVSTVEPVYVRSTIDTMLVERLQSKTQSIEHTLKQNQKSWNETFYQHLAINFGFKVNALPFELLSRSTPLKVLAHHTQNLTQLEALLFGQSGLLNEELLGDDYFLELRNEYSYLMKKYELKGMEGHVWKFMRLRPANFPTLRISQFAALMHQSKALFSTILETNKPADIKNYFKVHASNYWDTHYRFNYASKDGKKWLGESSQNNILINTVVPFLYLYGERNNKPDLKVRALELLELLPAEKNRIVDRWADLGIKSSNAYDSQALIQLKNVYCDYKKCLKCQIGTKVINR